MSIRVFANVLACMLIFLAPLAIHPERVLHPAPCLGLIAGLVMMLSQPAINFREASDRGSGLAIFGTMIASQIYSSLDFARAATGTSTAVFALGFVFVLCGMSLRLWSIRTLGRYFTAEVRMEDSQTIVQSGPYRVLRHPSYTGALLVALGTSIALGSRIGLALVFVLCVPAYLYRIRVEEAALSRTLGRAYRTYRSTVWGLVPGLR